MALAAAAAAMKLKNKGSVTVQVVVRCRPLNKKELGEDRKPIITIDENQVSIVKGIGKDGHIMSEEENKATKKSFTFDAAYDEQSTQKQFYEESCYPLVESVMEGFNGTIFAYGQTGCGKTWTMMGPPAPLELRGVIPSSFDHIFENIKTTTDCEFLVRCSYLEIYNEEIRDLLGDDPKARCELKEDPNKGVYVKGLSNVVVNDEATINKVMEKGLKHRTTGATLMNEGSSRSHSIFTVVLEMNRKDEGGNFVWPGFGENSRVLKWIFDRIEGKASAIETPIGNLPSPNSIDIEGLNLSEGDLQKLLKVERLGMSLCLIEKLKQL